MPLFFVLILILYIFQKGIFTITDNFKGVEKGWKPELPRKTIRVGVLPYLKENIFNINDDIKNCSAVTGFMMEILNIIKQVTPL